MKSRISIVEIGAPLAFLAYLSQLLSCGVGNVPMARSERTTSPSSHLWHFFDTPSESTGATIPSTYSLKPTDKDLTSGYTPGELLGRASVTEDGTSTYDVPIWAPPGRAGLTPRLSFHYDQRAGNGELGVGVSLAGLSRIAVCRTNRAQDGYVAPLPYTSVYYAQPYCLDGQRLILVSGEYLKAGSEYRTETDAYSKIMFRGGWFEVYNKDGTIASFGKRADAAHSVLSGTTVLWSGPQSNRDLLSVTNTAVDHSWAVDELSDRSGNYIQFNYRNLTPRANIYSTASNAEHYYEQVLSDVEYTGSTIAGAPLPTKRIVFYYDRDVDPDSHQPYPDRTDPQDFYVAGLGLSVATLLHRVDVFGPGATISSDSSQRLLRSYRLSYGPSNRSGRSLLNSITECDGQGVCKKPLSFQWTGQSTSPRFNDISIYAPDIAATLQDHPESKNFWSMQFADINGDGRDDLFYRIPTLITDNGYQVVVGRWYFRLAQPDGYGSATDALLPVAYTGDPSEDLHFADVLGTGTPQVLVLSGADPWPIFSTSTASYQLYRYRSPFDPSIQSFTQVTGFGSPGSITTPADFGSFSYSLLLPVPQVAFADLDGDGWPEYLRHETSTEVYPSQWTYEQNNWVGGLGAPQSLTGVVNQSNTFYTADVNGEGRTEFLVAPPGPTSPDNIPSAWFGSTSACEFVDFGNVGMPDHPICQSDLSALPFELSDQLQNALLGGSGGYYGDTYHYPRTWLVDLNGDGLPDAVSVRQEQSWDEGATEFFSGSPVVAMNTGHGFMPYVQWHTPLDAQISPSVLASPIDNGVRVADFDGDGRQDLLLLDDGSANLNLGSSCAACLRVHPKLLKPRGAGFAVEDLTDIPLGQNTGNGGDQYGRGWRLSQVLDFNGDGLPDVAEVGNPASSYLHIYVQNDVRPDLLKIVTGGRDQPAFTFTYSTTSNPSVYQPLNDTSALFPERPLNSRLTVVSKTTTSNIAPGCETCSASTDYFYEGARGDVWGQGFLGFTRITQTDEHTLAKTTITYSPDYQCAPYPKSLFCKAHRPASVVETVPLPEGGNRVSTETLTWAVRSPYANVYQAYLTADTRQITEGPSATPTLYSKTSYGVDTYGNVTSEVVSTALDPNRTDFTSDEPWIRRTRTATFDNDAINWLIGLERSETVLDETTDGPQDEQGNSTYETSTRTWSYTYDSTSGKVLTAVRSPTAGAEQKVQINLDYDSYGLPYRRTSIASGESRFEQAAYDSIDHTLVVDQQDALGHHTTTDYHAGLGLRVAQTDLNGVTTVIYYDGFGRPKDVDRPASDDSHYSYSFDSSGDEVVARSDDVSSGTQRTSTSVYGLGGRLYQRSYPAFDGSPVVETLKYDFAGRVISQQGPRNVGYAFDPIGRLSKITHEDGTTTSYAYAGTTTTQTDERGKSTRVVRDAAGRTVQAAENVAGSWKATSFSYGPFDVVETTTLPDGTFRRHGFDALGRLSSSTGPAGNETYAYDGFDEVVSHTNTGLSQTDSFDYDPLGRVVEHDSPSGPTTFTWDTAPNGVGELASATSADGVTQSFSYDSLGRPKTSAWGNAAIDVAYDDYGQLHTVTYPAVGSAGERFSVDYSYTPRGDLSSVSDGNGALLWSADGRDSLGALTAAHFGDGSSSLMHYDARHRLRFLSTSVGSTPLQKLAFNYDASGELTERDDLLARTTEDFVYDDADRLTKWTVSQACGSNNATIWNYDDLGRVTSREENWTDAGLAKTQTATFNYGESGANDEALTSQTVGGAQTSSYTYDSAGRVTSSWRDTSSPYASLITYGNLDLPRTISSSSGQISYLYDALGGRYSKTLNGIVTTYAGQLYESTSQAGQPTQHYFKVIAEGEQIATVQWTESAGTIVPATTLFIHSDGHHNAETITNQSGSVVETLKFSPFGERRDKDNLAKPNNRAIGAATPGFISKEADDEVGLTNLGGRIYDPTTGRFLSPDPMVSNPLNGRAYNAYTYARNNPMSRWDPSGYDDCPGASPCLSWGSTAGTSWSGTFGLEFGGGGRPTPSWMASPPPASAPASGTSISPPLASPADVAGSSVGFNAAISGFDVMTPNQQVAEFERGVGDGMSLATYFKEGRMNLSPMRAPIVLSSDYRPVPQPSGGYLFGRLMGSIGLATSLATLVPEAASGEFIASLGADSLTDAGRGTGAFLDGTAGGVGLGRVSDMSLRVSEKGLGIVESHLGQFGPVPENTAMIARLRGALESGTRISGADASFYLHELNEATLMGRGLTYEAAHAAALGRYGVSPFSVYHPDVILANPGVFNSNWFNFWGIRVLK